MTNPADSFWSGGGGKSLSWKNMPIGTAYTGTITAVHPPQQVTDPVDNKPVFKKDGVTPKLQARLDLSTSYRDPADPDDDGTRSLYVGGWMTGAIGDAIRKATGQAGPPQVGAVLRVTLIAREENKDNKALNPTNKFSAEYVPPAAAATGNFYADATAAAPPQPQPQPQYAPPPAAAMPQPQYAPPPAAAMPQPQQPMPGMPAPAPQYVPPVPGQGYVPPQPVPAPAPQPAPVPQPVPQAAGPAKPEGISDAAWAAMDPATRATVAATMGGATQAPPY